MDINKDRGPNGVAEWIFSSYFKPLMDPEDFTRARAIFRIAGWNNERPVAIQLFAALSHGKLDAVLDAYEFFTGPKGFLDTLTDVQRAAELKHFADFIYFNVIAGGNEQTFFAQVGSVEVPKVFNNMEIPADEGLMN